MYLIDADGNKYEIVAEYISKYLIKSNKTNDIWTIRKSEMEIVADGHLIKFRSENET